MSKDTIEEISESIIKSGIQKPSVLESTHTALCRQLIDLMNKDVNDPTIPVKIKEILTDMNLDPNSNDVLHVLAKIKELYIDNYM